MNVLHDYLKNTKFDKYVLPLVEQFDIAEALVKSGIDPKKLYTSDTSLFSCAYGYFLMDKSLESLDIIMEDIPFDIQKYETTVEQCAELFLALAYCQLPKTPYNNAAMRKELETNHGVYHKTLVEQLNERYKILHGLRFRIADANTVIQEHMDNESVLIYIEQKGIPYSKYRQNIYWNEPDTDELDIDKTLEDYQHTDATIMVETHTDEIPDKWTKIFAEDKNEDKTERTLINKKEDARWISRKSTLDIDSDWKLYNDEDITVDSIIQITKLNPEQAHYYKDLFHSKSGYIKSDIAVAYTVDGRLFAVSGLKFGKNHIYQTFSITVPSQKTIDRLLAYLLTSKEFENDIKRIETSLIMEDIKSIRATLFVHDLEENTLDKLMKRIGKEQMPNQIFKLTYDTEFHDRSYKECMVNWLNGK